MNHLKDWVSTFEKNRTYLLAFAFRMTGSLSEAEDIVQDTLLACADQPFEPIKNPKSWLTKVCSNKSLDHMKLAYKSREAYHGDWLPDAIPDSLQIWANLESQLPPEKHMMLAESLTTSFLHIAERLSPEERAVFLLSEVFDYSFREIAEFLGKSEGACRKVAERARIAVTESRPRFVPGDADEIVRRLFDLAVAGDRESLESMLAPNSKFWSDGGGKVSAVRHLHETRQIASLLVYLASSPVFKSPDYKRDFTRVNGLPGVTISRLQSSGEWAFETIMSFEFEDGKVVRMYAQRNPEKLKTLIFG